MNHYLLVKIKTTKKYNILLKLNKINVNIKNITYTKDYLKFEILASDLKKVKKYILSEKVEVIDETGIYKIKKELKKNLLIIVSIIFSVIIFLVLSNVIVKVNVIHSKKEIREILYSALKENGVEPLRFKKSYDEYEKIITKIKERYKDKIEWLEIDIDGMILNVRVEERIENKTNKNYNTCHIVAKKSGIVTDILTKKGITEVSINDYVNKGDILINGMIKLNEEIKENVCASGEVYAEVWYSIKGSLPLSYKEEKLTKKKRINFMIKNLSGEHIILKSRIKGSKEVQNIFLFKIGNNEFYIQKEIEKKVTSKKYTEEEALVALTNKIHEKLAVKGIALSDIMNEKVLKKNVINGNLDIEVFVAVKEQIGVVEYYKIETESGTDDREDNKDNNNIN